MLLAEPGLDLVNGEFSVLPDEKDKIDEIVLLKVQEMVSALFPELILNNVKAVKNRWSISWSWIIPIGTNADSLFILAVFTKAKDQVHVDIDFW